MPSAQLTPVAEFPEHYFLENLAVRADNSVLVTAMNQKELWYLPPPPPDLDDVRVESTLLHSFPQPATAIAETEPDLFYVATSDIYTTHESFLNRVDLRGWKPDEPVHAEEVLRFDDRARALNGGCMIAPTVMLIADSVAGLIWQVDLAAEGGPAADVWLKHPSMDLDPHSTFKPPQPGINGIRYAARTRFVYYTCTAQKLFMRVLVDPATAAAVGEPEQVGGGTMSDDFVIDEDAALAYVTTHRENTIDRVRLDGPPDQPRVSIAGSPVDELLLGPSSAAWGRGPGEYGRTAYVTTDGGTTAPLPDGTVRTAKILRIDLAGT